MPQLSRWKESVCEPPIFLAPYSWPSSDFCMMCWSEDHRPCCGHPNHNSVSDEISCTLQCHYSRIISVAFPLYTPGSKEDSSQWGLLTITAWWVPWWPSLLRTWHCHQPWLGSLLWCEFNPWPRNCCMPWAQPKTLPNKTQLLDEKNQSHDVISLFNKYSSNAYLVPGPAPVKVRTLFHLHCLI